MPFNYERCFGTNFTASGIKQYSFWLTTAGEHHCGNNQPRRQSHGCFPAYDLLKTRWALAVPGMYPSVIEMT